MKYTKFKRSKTLGYTLMEMVLVMAIIAVLMGMAGFFLVNVFSDAESAKIKSDMRTLTMTLDRYRTNSQTYPTTAQGLKALAERPSAAPVPREWKKLIELEGLNDPWGRIYQYRYPGIKKPDSFDIYSLGKDGIDGTGDEKGNWK